MMYLSAGDQAGYRRCCDESWKKLRDNYGEKLQRVDNSSAVDVARTCALAEGGVDDLAAVVALAQVGVRGHDAKAAATETLALALCRQRKPAEALTTLANLKQPRAEGAHAAAIRALAYHLQGHKDEAQMWLATAEREFTALPRFPPDDRYLAELLLKELRTILDK